MVIGHRLSHRCDDCALENKVVQRRLPVIQGSLRLWAHSQTKNRRRRNHGLRTMILILGDAANSLKL